MRVLVGLMLSALAGPAKPGDVPVDVPLAGARYQNAHLLAGPGHKVLGRFVAPGTYPVDAERLREERWCIESFPGAGGGNDFIAHVLVWLE